MVVWLVSRSDAPGDVSRTPVPATLTAAALFIGSYLAIAWFVGPRAPHPPGTLLLAGAGWSLLAPVVGAGYLVAGGALAWAAVGLLS